MEKISINDKEYPTRLREILNPPQEIYVIGNKRILNDDGIAIVGSRDCTKQGSQNARVFAVNFANAGFTIISGMAKGIDTASHKGALEANGKTIAVLGCGADYIYPAQNKEIYEQIIKNGGAIVSEYPSMTEPCSERFRQRNRIVSGLSLGVLIVEAEVISRDNYNREVCKKTRKRSVLHSK